MKESARVWIVDSSLLVLIAIGIRLPNEAFSFWPIARFETIHGMEVTLRDPVTYECSRTLCRIAASQPTVSRLPLDETHRFLGTLRNMVSKRGSLFTPLDENNRKLIPNSEKYTSSSGNVHRQSIVGLGP